MKTIFPQFINHRKVHLHIADKHRLRNLDVEHSRVNIIFFHQSGKCLVQINIEKIFCGNIDRDADIIYAPPFPVAEFRRGLLPHTAVKFVNIASFFNDFYEIRRHQYPLYGMVPSDNRLRA